MEQQHQLPRRAGRALNDQGFVRHRFSLTVGARLSIRRAARSPAGTPSARSGPMSALPLVTVPSMTQLGGRERGERRFTP
jgi:hypothetical protein